MKEKEIITRYSCDELKEVKPKEIEISNSENVIMILNLLDKLIAGQRFGEFDSAKQMYLLNCQTKIYEMQQGYYTENSVFFLNDMINSLIRLSTAAKAEVNEIFNKENENE